MSNSKKIMEMLQNNQGYITTHEVSEASIPRGSLYYLEKSGIIKRAERGVYQLNEVWEDELFNSQSRFKKGIYSNGTALFLHGLTDVTPAKYDMTFPIKYNTSNPQKCGIHCIRVIDELYEMGVTEVKTSAGNMVKLYNVERTLCDILRKHHQMDIRIISEAFNNYIQRNDKDIPKLTEYAKKLKVEQRLRSYLEVLL
jgi:predicted transcriptional regulator of viral defense system